MTDGSGSRGFLRARLGSAAITAVVAGLLGFAACFLVWIFVAGGAWRDEVRVMEAVLHYPDRLSLIVAACNENPSLSQFEETDRDVQVKVIAFSTPFHGGNECQDVVEVQLAKPLGDRVIIDRHTGQLVSVR